MRRIGTLRRILRWLRGGSKPLRKPERRTCLEPSWAGDVGYWVMVEQQNARLSTIRCKAEFLMYSTSLR